METEHLSKWWSMMPGAIIAQPQLLYTKKTFPEINGEPAIASHKVQTAMMKYRSDSNKIWKPTN
jgi:hypothetical protein